MASEHPVQLVQSAEKTRQQAWILWEVICNIVMAALFVRFMLVAGHGLLESFRISTLLITFKISMDAFFFLTRKMAKEVSISVYDWVIAIVGTFAPLFYVPVAGNDNAVASLVQLIGISMQVVSILSLNRSFGLVAANRGIKTRGMYRFVRHPLYFAYFLSFGGFVLNQPTHWNLFVYSVMIAFLYLRIHAEERLLLKNEEYREYCQKVRWRLVPYVI